VDALQFDRLIRTMGTPSRRGLSRSLGGLFLAGPLGLISGFFDAEAKKKKRKKKCKGGKKRCGKKCLDLQTDPLNCGSCGNGCDVGKDCADGKCSCPEGEQACGASCITQVECCTDADCGDGGTCVDGTCLCPVEKASCGGTCVDLAADGANCGSCNNVCVTGGCVNGACVCQGEAQCPEACTCRARLEGGAACRGPVVSAQACDDDDDCPLGTFCRTSDAKCTNPCVG
jgi:hypothetical protein